MSRPTAPEDHPPQASPPARTMGRTLSIGLVALALLLVAAMAGWMAPKGAPDDPVIDWNDNLVAAGSLAGGVFEIDLEVVQGTWHLLGPDEPGGTVYAFAERGHAPSIPGPMIRVPVGTEVRAHITNTLDVDLTLHGLGARRAGVLEPLEIGAGQSVRVAYHADASGTYYYWASAGDGLQDRVFEDSQLTGALIVDEVGAPTDDQVMVIGMWSDTRLEDGGPELGREYLVINGRPWPHTERLEYELGDTVRWRLINGSYANHAMHLHGFYYRVESRGDLAQDTIYFESQRRMAVTERMVGGTTMAVSWVAERPGGWIFHCHMAEHVVPNPPMGQPLTEEERFEPLYTESHHEADPDMHATEGMGGLVMGAFIRPPEGWQPNEPKRREMRLFIQSAPAAESMSGKQFAYVLQEGDEPPEPDSLVFPGSPLIIRKGEPTSIRVFNRLGFLSRHAERVPRPLHSPKRPAAQSPMTAHPSVECGCCRR